jgi:hypothetical protein
MSDRVAEYLAANFRPGAAADLLAAAQTLMAIAWDEGFAEGADCDGSDSSNPYWKP